MTDTELLEAWSNGDTAAAETLVRRHIDLVHRFFMGKVSVGIDDLVQRTFLCCVEKRSAYRGGGSFRAFLLGIARYELLDVYRQRASGRTFDPSVTSLHDMGERPSELLRAREERQVLLAALRTIPLDQQFLLELFYWEQLNASEIARVLDIPAPTVRGQLQRARKALAAAARRVAADSTLAQRTITSFESWASAVRDARADSEP